MSTEAFGEVLAGFNATLNLTSALLLLTGVRNILRKEIDKHRRCMIAAVTASGLFLVSYVVRFALTGTHTFEGPDSIRRVYLAMLFSHMVLAALVPPLVIRLLYLAGRKRFDEHRRLARWTFPAWLYVSLTGLVTYVMLYHAYG